MTASNSVDQEIRTNLRLNLVVNLLDGGFFGFALGFASFVTVIPLFVSSMTNSAILIGLIPAIHSVGWQLPQLFTAHRVSNQTRFKPMVMIMTIHERLPFLGLAIVAWFSPVLGTRTALFLTFLLLIWQGLGGGFTATGWQSMIGKIIPPEYRGTFFGSQSAAANLLASVSAIIAGIILQRLASPQDFTLAFICGFLAMVVSYIFLAQAREPARPNNAKDKPAVFWKGLGVILRKDVNFRWFLIARMLSQLAVTGFAFYTVYAVNSLGMSDFSVGVLTSVLLATQIIANPIMGLFGDRWSHRGMMIFGISASILSALIAWKAPTAGWFFPVMILAGISNVAIWTISLAMIQEFGTVNQRPAYIGLANTLIAPFTILAPFVGGIVANQYGYPAAFLISAVFGIITTMILIGQVRDPKTLQTVKLELQTGE